MNNDDYIVLVYKKIKGLIRPNEQKKLDRWLTNPEHEAIAQNLYNDWLLSGNYEPQVRVEDINLEDEYQVLQHKITSDKTSNRTLQLPLSSKTLLKYAAVVSMLIVASVAIYQQFLTPQTNLTKIVTEDGETKTIELIDGTVITLNEKSSLIYSSNFNKKNRLVKLEGEAFFDVNHQTDLPFEIKTPHTLSTVVGTSFNLEDYAHHSQAIIGVYNGKVIFKSPQDDESKLALTKGQQAIYNKESHNINTNITSYLNNNSWKTHQLIFNDTPLITAIKDIEDYYNCRIDLDEQMNDCSYNARINLKQYSLNELLNNITTVFQSKLIFIADGRYQISGQQCK